MEKEITAELLKRLRKVNKTWWYKIPDPTRCPGCGLVGLASKRPFDIVGCYEGKPVAIEVKQSSGIPLQPHQLAELRLFTMAGGNAFKLEKHDFYLIDPDGTHTHIGATAKVLFDYLR